MSAPAPSDEQRAEADETAVANGQKSQESPQQQRLEQLEIAELVSRDAEVRTHEQAHAAVGGVYAGAPTYTFTRGPDGKRYAVGGEVSIDVSAVPNDPEATLRKMEIVLRAALAPAEPSAQDLRVAAQAQAQMTQARVELAEQQRSEAAENRPQRAEETAQDELSVENPSAAEQAASALPSLELYRRLGGADSTGPLIDLRA
ncbi:putative metalloprotease CJM1_0395 family protein [Pseudomonas sp.]|uniref:putative metalloprotease CJM1_0395 family protein n=1 Tax=Pseudomonas sp. TaxID=306 RepID=UPI0039C972AB